MSLISIIVGSTRQGRFSEKPAKWISGHLQSQPGVRAQLLDLRDYSLPFFDQPIPPSTQGRAPYTDAVVSKWTAEIERSDAFIVIAPEYNHGVPAVLKNALDWVYVEWARKPVCFVSHGSVGGVRSVQHLRETAISLQMIPIRASVHIPVDILMTHFRGGDVAQELVKLDELARVMIAELLWFSRTLESTRNVSKGA